MEKKLLTKVAKGVAFGDVSNQSVRNILTEISKSLYGGITEQEMQDTLDFFDWKCPYTGKDLTVALATGAYATDHIYPQNRDWCGLNVKGNLVIVDKEANSAKKGLDIEEFMLDDSKFWTKLGVDKPTRVKRLEKIREFQKLCGYDPEKIRMVVSSMLQTRYDEVRAEQEKWINNALDLLKNAGICAVLTTTVPTAPVGTTLTTKKKKSTTLPEMIFTPANEEEFKKELLKTKKARFVLTYNSGHIKESLWKVNAFDETSNLRGNIQSRPFWRNKNKEGLVRVEVFID